MVSSQSQRDARWSVLWIGLTLAILLTSVAGPAVAHPHPRSDSTALWSGDTDDPSNATLDSDDSMAALAAYTDITYDAPPTEASRLTRSEFRRLRAGGDGRSLAPPHAERRDGRFIKDAHITVFAVQPATTLHRGSGDPTRLVAPQGTLRAFIDYRIEASDDDTTGRVQTVWSVFDDDVVGITLYASEHAAPLVSTAGTNTPVLPYDLSAKETVTLTISATIETRVRRQTTVYRNNTTVRTNTDYLTKRLTVSDTVRVRPHEPTARATAVSLPDGTTGVALDTSGPWRAIRFGSTTDAPTLRGPYRFYSARDTRWDRLTVTTTDETSSIDAPGHPVRVHAVPTRRAPAIETADSSMALLWVDGQRHSSPSDSIPEEVAVDIVSDEYVEPQSLLVSSGNQRVIPIVQVMGLVEGVSERLTPVMGDSLRRATLATKLSRLNDSAARLQVELDDPLAPRFAHTNSGFVQVGSERLEVPESGVATTILSQPGGYTVRYRPDGLTDAGTRMFATRESVYLAPESRLSILLDVLIDFAWTTGPLIVAFYALNHLSRTLTGRSIFRRRGR